MLVSVNFPELADRTALFSRGAPHAVTVSGDGGRVVFLRSGGPEDDVACLWTLALTTATETLIADPAQLLEKAPEPLAGGITGYAADAAARVAAFGYAGRLFRADLVTGEVVEVATVSPVSDPRPDPTGHRIAYTARDARTGTVALRVVQPDGTDLLLAGENEPGVWWGAAEPATVRAFGRNRGYWWSPDGTVLLAARAGTAHRGAGEPARTGLHLLDLDGGWVDVHWDRETYPYLLDVRWADGGPLITVLRRGQQHGLVLSVDPRTGETQVHAELADARWVEPVAGTPRHLPDGRVLVGGELAHDGYDARCLFADGSLLTPPGLYVRRVVGVLPRLGAPAGGPDLIVEASEDEPGEQHVFRIRTSLGNPAAEATRLTAEAGWHRAAVGGDVLVVGSRTLECDGVRWTVWRGDLPVATLRSVAAPAPGTPRPALLRVTDRRLPAGVLYPGDHVAGRRLPVLLDVGAGPGAQHVVADRTRWLARQWWAEAGFAVVSVDGRGTPGSAPSFEKVVYRRLAEIAVADQVDALQALVGKHPDLDLSRVAVRGQGLGGWLAVLAALARPDVVGCAVARTAVVDWRLLPPPVAERYLGPPDDGRLGGDVYARHDLSAVSPPGPDGPPVLLVHGLADETVPPEHAWRLSTALLATGHPHAVLPVCDAAGLESGHEARLLPQELSFVRHHLPRGR
jgi:dipeptidyl-peptidase-4